MNYLNRLVGFAGLLLVLGVAGLAIFTAVGIIPFEWWTYENAMRVLLMLLGIAVVGIATSSF